MEKRPGKIAAVSIALRDGPESDLVIKYTFSAPGWSVEHCEVIKWFNKKPHLLQKHLDEAMSNLDNLAWALRLSKSENLHSLVNKPVEVVFDDNTITFWRILVEVI
jgi:hypothetical protein